MGETGAAGTGINSVFWNPAGLNSIESGELSVMHASWLEGINFQNISYARKTRSAVVGLSAVYLSVPAIDKYDNTGLKTNGTYKPADMAVIFSYAANAGACACRGQPEICFIAN